MFATKEAHTGAELKLAMQELFLGGRILPVGARLVVRHVFRSAEEKPLEAIYSFALPRDAALRSFRVSGEGFQAHSELKPIEEAVQQYEHGIAEGHLASLARQYRDGVVNLTLGNIRPGEKVEVLLELIAGVELRDDGLRFRFPFTLAPSYHPRARAIESEPGLGEQELPEDQFGDVILPRYAKDAARLHGVGFELKIHMAQEIEEIGSPSHAVRFVREGAQAGRLLLAADKDVPDRDLVLDVRTREAEAGALGGPAEDGRRHFAAVFPSRVFGEAPSAARRVVVVLDRSGSMGGAPIAQARKAFEACLGALSPQDRFGLVVFDNQNQAFRPELQPAGTEERRAAREFLERVDARGGTELAPAFERAAGMLGSEGGDVLVLTDGQVAGTEDILARARAAGARIHCLGIGSASQDRFLALLARETGGVSRFVTARERIEPAALDLFAGVGSPVVENVNVDGALLAPEAPRCVFAGTPLALFGTAEEGARLKVECSAGRRVEIALELHDAALGEAMRLLQGARLLTDLEARLAAPAAHPAERREQRRIEEKIEALSRELGLASRRLALVAVVERAGDRPGEIPRTEVVPVGMPQDTPFEAYFGAPAAMPAVVQATAAPMFALACGVQFQMGSVRPPEVAPPEDLLLDLAARLEPDGGMPGPDQETRVLHSLIALLCFTADGSTERRGVFRAHVRRLLEFLAAHGVDARRKGAPPGPWRALARQMLDGRLDPSRARHAIEAARIHRT